MVAVADEFFLKANRNSRIVRNIFRKFFNGKYQDKERGF